MLNEKDLENLRKQYNIVKVLAWISIFLIILAMTFVIVGSSHADANSAAQAVANPYSGSGGNSVSGLLSYGQQNINLSCNQSPNFLNVSYTVGSSGDITATIQMNTNNGSGYNSSYTIPDIISGICSNGFISCPAGQWYGNGITCQTYSVQYSPSAGFTLDSLGANIISNPQSSTVSVPLNGTQVSTVTNPNNTSNNGLANCFCLNDSCEQGGQPLSEIQVQQILTDLGGQVVSAVQSGSPDTVGGSTVNDANTPYSITYSGGNSSTCNGNSNYNTANNLEGLYNQGGSALNNEVSSSQTSTADQNTASALGLTGGQTPTGLLITTQNNAFGGVSNGTCQIQNLVSFSSKVDLAKADFAPFSASWSGGGSHTGASYTISNSGGDIVINQSEGISYAGGPDCSPSGSITLSITSSGISAVTSGGLFVCSGSIGISNNELNPGTISCPDNGSCAPRFGWNITESSSGSNAIQLSTFGTGAGWAPSNSYNVNLNDNVYYPVYSQPVNTCSSYQGKAGCSLISEQVCDQNDSNCVTTLQNSNPVGTPPAYNWTYEQTDDNLPVSAITWSIAMNGASVQVTPSETTDTINFGTLATSSSSAGGGNDFPYVNETWACQGNPAYNFAPEFGTNGTYTAVANSGSMNSDNSAFSYTGINGNTHSNISVDNSGSSATQEECVVTQTNTNTGVTNSLQATTANQNTPADSTTTNTKTLNCTNSGTVNNPTWNCPVPSGYTIQTDCTDAGTINNNNFAPAVVGVEVLDKAGSQLICSSN